MWYACANATVVLTALCSVIEHVGSFIIDVDANSLCLLFRDWLWLPLVCFSATAAAADAPESLCMYLILYPQGTLRQKFHPKNGASKVEVTDCQFFLRS